MFKIFIFKINVNILKTKNTIFTFVVNWKFGIYNELAYVNVNPHILHYQKGERWEETGQWNITLKNILETLIKHMVREVENNERAPELRPI